MHDADSSKPSRPRAWIALFAAAGAAAILAFVAAESAYGWSPEGHLRKIVPWCPPDDASPHFSVEEEANTTEAVYAERLLAERGWANIHHVYEGHYEVDGFSDNPADPPPTTYYWTIQAHYCKSATAAEA